MAFLRDLWIEHDGDRLTVHARNRITQWIGALFVSVGLGLTVAATIHLGHISRPWIVFLCGALSIICGAVLLVPYVCTTMFDMRARQLVHNARFGHRWTRTQCYSFEDIAGLALNKDKFISHCSPYLELKKPGGRLLLCPSNGFVSVTAGVTVLEAICDATSMPVLDLESWF